MKKVIAIAASTKQVSMNKTLLLLAMQQLKFSECNLLSLSTIDLPLFSEELEKASGIPDAVEHIYHVFTEADGFILACPEHNGLPPVGFKNFFDWMSRIHQKVFQQKPVLLLSASPGVNGGASNLQLLKKLLPHWGGKPAGMFSLGSFYQKFNCTEMKIDDALLGEQLTNEVRAFETNLMQN